METVNVGRSGLRVSRLCLGTMIFGSQLDEPAAFAVMDRARELGIDFFDTADVYPVPPAPETWGRTEEVVGRWRRNRGESVTVATKCVNRVGPGSNDLGGGRKHVIEACEASIRRLQLERLDVFYLHHSDLGAPTEEALEARTGSWRTARCTTSEFPTSRPGRWAWRWHWLLNGAWRG